MIITILLLLIIIIIIMIIITKAITKKHYSNRMIKLIHGILFKSVKEVRPERMRKEGEGREVKKREKGGEKRREKKRRYSSFDV